MQIRRLVIASLIAGAASAQAGNIPTSAAQQSSVVSGWTTGNGTDVLGSGVLQGSSLNLVAGIAHTADASLSDILYGKVAGSVQQVQGQTKLFFQRGIEANYLLASGHGILAATAGLGKSVVGSSDGAIISDGVVTMPVMAGGGGNTAGNVGGGAGGTTGGNAMPTLPSASQGGSNGGVFPGQGNGIGLGNGPLVGGGGSVDIGIGGSGGFGDVAGDEGQAAEVPEPSSIALMLLGMVGAGAITRRRSR